MNHEQDRPPIAGTGAARSLRESRGWAAVVWGLVLATTAWPTGLPTRGADQGDDGPMLVIQSGREDTVIRVAASPSSELILTGNANGRVQLWQGGAGRYLRDLPVGRDGETIVALTFAPRDRYAAAGGLQKTIWLWETATGRPLPAIRDCGGIVTGLAFTPDTKHILSTTSDGVGRLWTMDGQEVRQFRPPTGGVRALDVAPDGNWLATVGDSPLVSVWNFRDGTLHRTLRGHRESVTAVCWLPDSKRLLSAGADQTARLWDVAGETELHRFAGHTSGIASLGISRTGHVFVSSAFDKSARLWDVEKGVELLRFSDHTQDTVLAAISRDGSYVVTTAMDQAPRIWCATTGKELGRLSGKTLGPQALALSRQGHWLAVGGRNGAIVVWDLLAGKPRRTLRGHGDVVTSLSFAPDDKHLVSGSWDDTVRIWDVASGGLLRTVAAGSHVAGVAWVGTQARVAFGCWDGCAYVVDVESGERLRRLTGHRGEVGALAISPDGTQLATGGSHPDNRILVWNLERNERPHEILLESAVRTTAYSPDGRYFATGEYSGNVFLWHATTRQRVARISHPRYVSAAAFSPRGDQLLTGGLDPSPRVWTAPDGAEMGRLDGHFAEITAAGYAPDGRTIFTASSDHTVNLWKPETRELWCSLVSFENGDWAAVSPSGLFDAHNAGDVEGLHWVVGTETMALAQLRERYHEPGLLAKVLGFNREPLRGVGQFRRPSLFPDAILRREGDSGARVAIDLGNQGGGLGRVVVRLNGKEVSADARGDRFDPDGIQGSLQLDLSNDPRLIPGAENVVEVVAYNKEGYLASRDRRLSFRVPGQVKSADPEVWAVIAGVSDYRGEAIDLRYAAKDAEDFAAAVRIAANRLFGPDKARLTLLSTSNGETARRPTRENLLAALDAANAAKPADILLVYLAGHGVNHGGQNGDFYYLTADAQSAELSDPEVRDRVAVSSQLLAERLKQIPALKQVLILDTCASGRLVEKLTERRDVPSSQVRALERVKDRTGTHILAGCAADAVSYEASQYGQGLLTHSLTSWHIFLLRFSPSSRTIAARDGRLPASS